MVRKTTVLNEMKIKGGGIYAITPFQEFDEHNMGVFKIGMSVSSLDKRIDSYATSFPMGVYIASVIDQISIPARVVKRSHYEEIERFIYDEVIARGGKAITSSTRLRYQDRRGFGRTEWVYTSPQIITSVFKIDFARESPKKRRKLFPGFPRFPNRQEDH
jgi:hypothetical protein